MKAELESIIRKELNLPDNAVITRASFQITEKDDEIRIIGSTLVEYQDECPGEEEYVALKEDQFRVKAGRKKRVASGRTPKARSGEKAENKDGSKITDAQIKGYKATLHARISAGNLSESQIGALESMKGIHTHKLNSEQRQQIKDIFEDTNPNN